jgi:hypothetical protein
VEIDAKNGYLPEHDDELELFWEGEDPANRARIVARSELLGGKTRWMFAADQDAPDGHFIFGAQLRTAGGLLEDRTTLTITNRPPRAASKEWS